MSTPKTRQTSDKPFEFPMSPANYNARIEEGLRRAPVERAKAVREFWGWIRAAI